MTTPQSRPYIVPFATILVFLAVHKYVPAGIEYPLRCAVLVAVLVFVSRHVINLRVRHFAASLVIGIAVFLIWIGPDLLFPSYRAHWLFQNTIMGKLESSLSNAARLDPTTLFFRALMAIVLVPIAEELFWRSWLMRWLISPKFESVPLGAYSASSFWITALLFASEHGAYWDVGLLAGIAYNWWMLRTKSLGDCILAHAVTNGCLAGYVLAAGKWEYWL